MDTAPRINYPRIFFDAIETYQKNNSREFYFLLRLGEKNIFKNLSIKNLSVRKIKIWVKNSWVFQIWEEIGVILSLKRNKFDSESFLGWLDLLLFKKIFFKNIFKRELYNWFRIKKKQKQIFYRIMHYWATIKKKKNVRKFAWLLTEHVHENDIYCEWRPLPWLIHLSAPQWNSLVLRTRLRE